MRDFSPSCDCLCAASKPKLSLQSTFKCYCYHNQRRYWELDENHRILWIHELNGSQMICSEVGQFLLSCSGFKKRLFTVCLRKKKRIFILSFSLSSLDKISHLLCNYSSVLECRLRREAITADVINVLPIHKLTTNTKTWPNRNTRCRGETEVLRKSTVYHMYWMLFVLKQERVLLL